MTPMVIMTPKIVLIRMREGMVLNIQVLLLHVQGSRVARLQGSKFCDFATLQLRSD
jgi:hypothetical protein